MTSKPLGDQLDSLDRLERRARRQDILLLALVLVIVLLAGVSTWQNRAVVDQADILARRAPVLTYIEKSSTQSACGQRLQAGYETALAQVVLGSLDKNPPAVADGKAALAKAYERLRRIDDICPPVDVPASQKETTTP